MKDPGFETICAHLGEDRALYEGAVSPPIFQTSLFVSPDAETFVNRGKPESGVYDYTRIANPTTDILQAKLAALERTESARCFGSGMAAVTASIQHCVQAGDHIVAVDTIYGPTRAFLTGYVNRFGVETTFVPGAEVCQFEEALRPNTRLIYVESPSSLVFNLQDLRSVARLGRERGITTAVDNSWSSPYFQNPIELGIDLVVHSATCLLYTSPSPRDLSTSRMPSSA